MRWEMLTVGCRGMFSLHKGLGGKVQTGPISRSSPTHPHPRPSIHLYLPLSGGFSVTQDGLYLEETCTNAKQSGDG